MWTIRESGPPVLVGAKTEPLSILDVRSIETRMRKHNPDSAQKAERARSVSVLVAFVLAVCSPAALAGSAGTLTVQGTIPQSCGLSGPSGAIDLGNIAAAGSKDVTISVDCNAPFAYAVVSTNHALIADAPPAVAGGSFNTSLPYTLSTSFETDGASFGDSNIPSANLTSANAAPCQAPAFDPSCPFANSGDTVAIQKTGRLTLSWDNPSSPLTAGTFSDTITLTVRVML